MFTYNCAIILLLQSDDQVSESNDAEEVEEGGEEEEEEDSSDDDDEGEGFIEEEEIVQSEITEDIGGIIRKVRRITRMFRKSPVKNDCLQKYCQEAHGLELQMIIDVRTRWNSLLQMVGRFLRIQKEIEKALINFSLQEEILSEPEIRQLRSLKEVLEVVEISSTTLASNKTDLFQGDCILEFLLSQTAADKSLFGQKMHAALERRVVQRRNPRIAGLLRYLSSKDNEESILTYPSKSELSKIARDIYLRLFTTGEVLESGGEAENESEPAPKRTMLEELQFRLAKAKSAPTPLHKSQPTGNETLQVKQNENSFRFFWHNIENTILVL